MSDLAGADSAPPEERAAPVTGLPAVDEALARLADLDEQPVAEHHESLSAAHETLHDALQAPNDVQSSPHRHLPPNET